MALYTSESRDRVRDAVDFVEVVSAHTELRRAGPSRYEGLCPFHDERTPSFGIDPVQKVYHCFGCQASGDVFTFVQAQEGVDFKGALELLAERYGVELEREQEDPAAARRRMRRERLLELLARTADYYQRYLWESREAARAREYLSERGLREEILREFRVGYAPSAWDRVLTASRRGGFSEEELYAAGLVQRSRQSGAPYDRFRARITFPLSDLRGRVLGFGARAMHEERGPGGAAEGAAGAAGAPRAGARGASEAGRAAAGGGGPPKYLNTSDNEIYHKGRHLYGAHLARAAAARVGEMIVCEGYTDTIALHQAGIRNAVGLMGTALTAEQLGELGRMARTVLLALDADASGQEAMLRASRLASERKLELRVVELPDGADPAELLQRDGAEAMQALVSESVAFVRFRLERVLADGDHASPEGRDRMLEQLRPVFAAADPGAVSLRLELTRLVCERLGLPESLVERALGQDEQAAGPRRASAPPGGGAQRGGSDARVRTGPGRFERAAGAQAQAGVRGSPVPSNGAEGQTGGVSVAARGTRTERAFLALCIASPGMGAQALAELELEEHFTSPLLRRAATHLRGHLSEPAGGLPDGDVELAALMAELVVEAGREAARPQMLEVQRLQLELARMEREIRRTRSRHGGDVASLARRRSEVKREFDRAYARVLEETGQKQG